MTRNFDLSVKIVLLFFISKSLIKWYSLFFSNAYNFSDTLKCFFAYNIDKDNITYLKIYYGTDSMIHALKNL